ncbi:MAG: class I SAM-dependent methyltransferase [Halolamina sp.]
MSDDAEDPASRFADTAPQYAVYRPEYDNRAYDYLRRRFALDRESRVLDLGCGTGRIGVALAPDVGDVVGIDPNEAMITHARERASVAGVENTEWWVGSDADLPDRAPDLDPLRLTTMGRSFHWMDQERTLRTLHDITEPGGGVAIFGDTEWVARGTADWQDEVYGVLTEFLDDPPERTGPVEYDDPWDEKLATHGFGDAEKVEFETERAWDADGVVGYLLSLSFCSPAVLGEERAAFEEAVRERLAAFGEPPYEETATVSVIAGER